MGVDLYVFISEIKLDLELFVLSSTKLRPKNDKRDFFSKSRMILEKINININNRFKI